MNAEQEQPAEQPAPESAPQAASWDEDALWQAVLDRDEDLGAGFVYGVASTRIFCRANCPSRRPRRASTRFFATPQQAIEAGFRACKRCRPLDLESAPGCTLAARIQQACRIIEESGHKVTLEALSLQLGISAGHLQRSFKRAMGVSPRQYADAVRLQKLKQHLRAGEPILCAQLEAGYGSSRALYERSQTQLGMTPATYGRGGIGARIRFEVASCELGFFLVAATDAGICAVSLGDTAQQLESELRQEFFAAHIERDEQILSDWMPHILELLHHREPHASLPLDVRATAFQWRVWQELTRIGVGQTRTYSQVAQAIGAPSGVRAVARACATNPIALIVPCHRVLRQGGTLVGYRWGLQRKQKLLEREARGEGGVEDEANANKRQYKYL